MRDAGGARRRPWLRHGLLLAAWALPACIVPDAHIDVRGEFVNPGTVRLIQSVPITSTAHAACRDVDPQLPSCPTPPETLPFGRIDLSQPFCVCAGGDNNALSYFDIYVEDPDLDDDGHPKDSILAALLLDMPSATADPTPYLAYQNILPSTLPAALVGLGAGAYADAIDRPEPVVRRWTLGTDHGVDLCNDNAAAPDGKLTPGLHSLRVIVTDRPWYRPFEYGPDGMVVLDADGEPVRVDATAATVGVPDLPGGATYSVADYVFRCRDGLDPDAGCNCAEEM
ncbi:MAG: hypothetical protein K1X88_28540 [Nannocystaceae bacterium]|nr:hypothetical protein [Nannocystaceae bacterium]